MQAAAAEGIQLFREPWLVAYTYPSICINILRAALVEGEADLCHCSSKCWKLGLLCSVVLLLWHAWRFKWVPILSSVLSFLLA